MIQRMLLSIPLAIAWMMVTGNVAIDSFLIGMLVSFLVLKLVFPKLRPRTLQDLRLIDRSWAAVQYTVILARDVFLSAVDVARRVIDPKLPMNPGIIAVPTDYQADPDDQIMGDLVAAVSAHGITITPGELVVEFDGNRTLFVHCLDVEVSSANASANQAKRLALLKRIFE